MYKKVRKINEDAIDKRLYIICEDFLKVNETTIFAISKKYIEKLDNECIPDVKQLPVIFSSSSIEDLIIPPGLTLNEDGYISTWCDNDPLIKLVHKNFNFVDLDSKNGKKVKHLEIK